MASLYKRKGSDLWSAKIRAWNAASGKWEWKPVATGQTDKSKAAGIAATLEGLSAQCKAGNMTRDKALAAVNDILRLAGMHTLETVPSLEVLAKQIMDSPGIAAGTRKKYSAHWDAFRDWAKGKVANGCDTWQHSDASAYYAHCMESVEVTTANNRMTFLSSLFQRAIALGHRAGNPTHAVERRQAGAVNKGTISRDDCAKLLRAMKRAGNMDWFTLALLGWHTGHRIQDLLNVTSANVQGDLLSIRPAKKSGRGREVVLPIPCYLCRLIQADHMEPLRKRGNAYGHISMDFIAWLETAKIDPQYLQRKARKVAMVSFHSFRHSMVSRLTAAGVSGDVARMVTDHDSAAVHRRYQHAEVEALREALRKAR